MSDTEILDQAVDAVAEAAVEAVEPEIDSLVEAVTETVEIEDVESALEGAIQQFSHRSCSRELWEIGNRVREYFDGLHQPQGAITVTINGGVESIVVVDTAAIAEVDATVQASLEAALAEKFVAVEPEKQNTGPLTPGPNTTRP